MNQQTSVTNVSLEQIVGLLNNISTTCSNLKLELSDVKKRVDEQFTLLKKSTEKNVTFANPIIQSTIASNEVTSNVSPQASSGPHKVESVDFSKLLQLSSETSKIPFSKEHRDNILQMTRSEMQGSNGTPQGESNSSVIPTTTIMSSGLYMQDKCDLRGSASMPTIPNELPIPDELSIPNKLSETKRRGLYGAPVTIGKDILKEETADDYNYNTAIRKQTSNYQHGGSYANRYRKTNGSYRKSFYPMEAYPQGYTRNAYPQGYQESMRYPQPKYSDWHMTPPQGEEMDDNDDYEPQYAA